MNSPETYIVNISQPNYMTTKIQNNYKGGIKKMGFEPTKPSYSGDGISIWNATDKNGKEYLKVKVLGGNAINCFRVEKE